MAVKRPSFTAKQRLKCFEDHGAIVLCQCDDPDCDTAIYIKGCPIDHWLALVDGGKHEDSNFRPISPGCHARKSAREHKANSKAKRIVKKREGTMKRRGKPMQSRGFDKTLTKRFDGKVVAR